MATKLGTVTASPHEVAAPCRHYGLCGGCTLQNLAYAAQLEAKEREVRQMTLAIYTNTKTAARRGVDCWLLASSPAQTRPHPSPSRKSPKFA